MATLLVSPRLPGTATVTLILRHHSAKLLQTYHLLMIHPQEQVLQQPLSFRPHKHKLVMFQSLSLSCHPLKVTCLPQRPTLTCCLMQASHHKTLQNNCHSCCRGKCNMYNIFTLVKFISLIYFFFTD